MKYYLLSEPVQEATKKAIGIITGTNNSMIKQNLKLYLTWIPRSVIRQLDNKTYIPYWFINQNPELKTVIDFTNYIEAEGVQKPKRTRKTKEQKDLESYALNLNSWFNGEIPNEYIEYWFIDEDNNYSLSDARFTTTDKLQGRIDNEEIVKINIVRNGNKEIIRG